MKKTSVLSAFNNHLLEFVNDMYSMFPNDNEIGATRNYFLFVKKNNPRLLLTWWTESIVKLYRKEIEAGNIDFLINKNYNKDFSTCDNTSEIITKIDTLRKPINNMNATDKKKIIKYFKNLTKISDLDN